jgi:hypothetical protein
MRRLLREPLLLYLAFGVGVVAVQRVFGGQETAEVGVAAEAAEPGPIVVDDRVVAERERRLRARLGRAPTEAELAAAVETWIDEEVLLREARAAGLDREDTVIRARLVRQAAFLAAATTVPPEPTEAELRALYTEVADEFRVPDRLTVRQVFVSGDDEARAAALQAEWAAGADGRVLGEAADDPPGGPVLRARTVDHLERQLGAGFAGAAAGLEVGGLARVRGAEGWHVIRLEDRTDGDAAASFEAARGRLVVRWKAAWIDRAQAEAAAAARGRYEVVGWP